MAELERQKRVMSMMITAHSVLRDKYLSLSSIFENILLIASVILNALVFIDAQFILKTINISEESQRLITGIASIIVFAISVVLLQVKWKEKAEGHANASNKLFSLLQECKSVLSLPENDEKNLKVLDFHKKYSDIFETLVKIPDNKFNSLKLKHNRKVELSKLIDKYPGSLLWILKIRLFLNSFKEKK